MTGGGQSGQLLDFDLRYKLTTSTWRWGCESSLAADLGLTLQLGRKELAVWSCVPILTESSGWYATSWVWWLGRSSQLRELLRWFQRWTIERRLSGTSPFIWSLINEGTVIFMNCSIHSIVDQDLLRWEGSSIVPWHRWDPSGLGTLLVRLLPMLTAQSGLQRACPGASDPHTIESQALDAPNTAPMAPKLANRSDLFPGTRCTPA